MTRGEAEAAVRKHGGQARAAKALGLTREKIRWALRQGGSSVKPSLTGGRSLADFRATYDKSYIIPRKIKAALTSLGSGWEYEVGFAKAAAVSLSDLGAFRDQFADHVVTLGREGRRAWAGTKSTAEAMRKML